MPLCREQGWDTRDADPSHAAVVVHVETAVRSFGGHRMGHARSDADDPRRHRLPGQQHHAFMTTDQRIIQACRQGTPAGLRTANDLVMDEEIRNYQPSPMRSTRWSPGSSRAVKPASPR
jgi:hypothetical protein